jgi:hypothetical protein
VSAPFSQSKLHAGKISLGDTLVVNDALCEERDGVGLV